MLSRFLCCIYSKYYFIATMRQDRFDYSLHFKLSLVSSYRPLAIQAPLVRDVSGSYASGLRKQAEESKIHQQRHH